MKLENQLTTLETSKKLKELGVKQDSIWWWNWWDKDAGDIYTEILDTADGFASAFTVAELGEILPSDSKDVVSIQERSGDRRCGNQIEPTEVEERAKM